jgi:hypothetical protein
MMLIVVELPVMIWLISLTILVIVTFVLCLVNLAGFGQVRKTIEQIARSVKDRNLP